MSRSQLSHQSEASLRPKGRAAWSMVPPDDALKHTIQKVLEAALKRKSADALLPGIRGLPLQNAYDAVAAVLGKDFKRYGHDNKDNGKRIKALMIEILEEKVRAL